MKKNITYMFLATIFLTATLFTLTAKNKKNEDPQIVTRHLDSLGSTLAGDENKDKKPIAGPLGKITGGTVEGASKIIKSVSFGIL